LTEQRLLRRILLDDFIPLHLAARHRLPRRHPTPNCPHQLICSASSRDADYRLQLTLSYLISVCSYSHRHFNYQIAVQILSSPLLGLH